MWSKSAQFDGNPALCNVLYSTVDACQQLLNKMFKTRYHAEQSPLEMQPYLRGSRQVLFESVIDKEPFLVHINNYGIQAQLPFR